MKTARERLLDVLRKDLIGPAQGERETINAWPSDQYISGILYPESVEANDEDDNDRDSAEDSEDSPGAAIPISQMRRPTLMGISFALAGDAPRVRLRARCARYEPASDADDDHRPTSWMREPLEVANEYAVGESLDRHDAHDGLCWWIRGLRTEAGWQVTVVLQNTATYVPGRVGAERATWFQVEFEARAGHGCHLVPRQPTRAVLDEDAQINALIYRSVAEWAVGHTCAADWWSEGEEMVVGATWIPLETVPAVNANGHPFFREEAEQRQVAGGTCFDAETLAGAPSAEALAKLLEAVPAAYERWQEEVREAVSRAEAEGQLSPSLVGRARENLDIAAQVSRRMRSGIAVLCGTGSEVFLRAFQLSQRAMLMQRRWSEDKSGASLTWRPFQLAFILLTLESIARPTAADGNPTTDRLTMDLLWFPTGGGKTEAYLGLTAFVILLRRLREKNPDDGDGVAVLMRYTLRLLTTQQFERAARLVLACETLRRDNASQGDRALGKVPFSIGLWVGEKATPNKRDDARADADARRRAQQLARCPACNGNTLRWDPPPSTGSFGVECSSKNCSLHGTPLPVWTIDQDIYEQRPSLLIGTIDKFAQIVRKPETHALLRGLRRPPELIIQDELHLISGPLGTVAGIYESALDLICTHKGIPAKIVGSTATIRRAREQVRHLFDREVMQFPPPVLDSVDSCFAIVDRELPGRLYAGFTTAGRSPKFILQAVCASLMQAASEPVLRDDERNPFWTLVAYFNSLRELGGAVVMMQDDVDDSMKTFATQHGTAQRRLAEPMELTSRVNQADIPQMLVDLADNYDEHSSQADQLQTTAVVLATNMISVGVDIPRLGLMVVNGQPKGMSEYIQSTSRVGRNRVAGLVVTVYNAGRPRDRSHYEAFRTWHQTLYREVEATSVTPYASRARDRALHAAIVALSRHLVDGMLDDTEVTPSRRRQIEALIDELVRRVDRADPEESLPLRGDAVRFLDDWQRRGKIERYWNDYRPTASLLVSAEVVATAVAAEGGWNRPAIGTPNSMRDVEPEVEFRMAEALSKQGGFNG